jgi:phospholipid/cholesterol/gamma-HCH transport system substrate-binding protein
MAAMTVLVVLIFLMSGSSGGLFARKLALRAYFDNAAGLKDGAPVTLEGVTIGNVIHVGVVADTGIACIPTRLPPSTRPAYWATASSISAQPTRPVLPRTTTQN